MNLQGFKEARANERTRGRYACYYNPCYYNPLYLWLPTLRHNGAQMRPPKKEKHKCACAEQKNHVFLRSALPTASKAPPQKGGAFNLHFSLLWRHKIGAMHFGDRDPEVSNGAGGSLRGGCQAQKLFFFLCREHQIEKQGKKPLSANAKKNSIARLCCFLIWR